MNSNPPALFTLVLAFLLFDMGLSSQTEAPAGSYYKVTYAQYNNANDPAYRTCEYAGCRAITTQSQCTEAMRASNPSSVFHAVYNWGDTLPKGCVFASNYWYLNTAGSSSKPCLNPQNTASSYGCACLCPNPTRAPTPAPTSTPTTSTPTSTPTTLSPTSTPTTLAPTLTVCQTLKGEIKDKCGPESPVNKLIQKAQDAVDTSPQDPMVDLGEYKLSDLEKEQKEGTCGFAKSDPAYLATGLVLKINKLSTDAESDVLGA